MREPKYKIGDIVSYEEEEPTGSFDYLWGYRGQKIIGTVENIRIHKRENEEKIYYYISEYKDIEENKLKKEKNG